ncbi:PfkB domain protein [Streptomyces bingchenggensis BCW-1]|uniref:PfkB domain protein n=1 Tax=Streptomyces bingchenggensis (strain BCW-1) TaxID=749414 RepID=D7C1R6_STRBB|nr:MULTISPECIES: PfkB family carbohydrate kinase [Streptomyces]ADI10131.1 PfkB domain protein [Streptomyces bingchenggensis BCW-1]
MLDALFAGGVFCDLVFGGIPHLPSPGSEVYADRFAVAAGGTATRCVAAARQGLETGLFAVIGTDLFGDHLAAVLGTQPGLDLRWLRRDPSVHTPITVAVANEHDRAFITYEEDGARRPDTWDGELPRVRVLHLGIADPLPGWATELRARGTLVVGGVGWDPTGAWSPDLLTRLGDVDVFVPNATEAMNYTRTDSVEKAVKVLADHVPLVVVTDGPRGAVSLDPATGGLVRVPSPRVTVADPTGAGDVFTASLMTALLQDGWPLTSRLRYAAICASMSVRTLGGAAGAPTPAAIRAFLGRMPGSDLPDQDRALFQAALQDQENR